MDQNVFPTHVGMNRNLRHWKKKKPSVPHTRGDEPPLVPDLPKLEMCSPHTWG